MAHTKSLNSNDTLQDRMRLSECFEKMRKVLNDKDINNHLQDKEFSKLAIQMGDVARMANECSGILFHFHIMVNTNILETVEDDAVSTDGAAGMPPIAVEEQTIQRQE